MTLLAAVLLVHAASELSAQTAGSYFLYPTAVTGSARDVGLAGSIVAYPRDYDTVFINPAGLGGLCGSGLDFGSDSSNIDDFVTNLSNPKSKALNDPIKFSFEGFRFVSDDGWGLGFAYQQPNKIDDVFNGNQIQTQRGARFIKSNDQTEIQVLNNVYTIALGKSLFDHRMSMGLGLNYVQVKESYDFSPVAVSSPAVHQSALGDTFSVDVGLIGRPWDWLQVGAVYKMGYMVPFDSSRNPPTPLFTGLAPFRNTKSPDRLTVGLAWMPVKQFTFFAQSSYIKKITDSLAVGSGVFPGGGNIVQTGQREAIDGHWGMELVPVDEPDLTMKFWAGGYLEDTQVQGGYSRYHRTAGLQFSPWFLSLSMAVDDAEYYNNFSVGLGIDAFQVADRVAKYWGYKLPI